MLLSVPLLAACQKPGNSHHHSPPYSKGISNVRLAFEGAADGHRGTELLIRIAKLTRDLRK